MLTLQSGDSSLVLAPELGGAIVGWTLGSRPLLRRAMPDAIIGGNVRGLGCFSLVPYSNRIAHGRFRWGGIDYSLARNFGDHPHSIHGVGWQRAWEVAAVGTASATLTLRHDARGEQARSWPFAFAAEQRFTLSANALRVALTIRNLHAAAVPAGLGLHPYFPRADAPKLRFNAQRVWLNGADHLPSEVVPVPAGWNHASAKPIGAVSLDNCFAGWDGTAHVVWSDDFALRIDAGALFRHLIVYTPPGQDFFCMEPVSHMNDAINRITQVPDHGLHILQAGETLEGEVTFTLQA